MRRFLGWTLALIAALVAVLLLVLAFPPERWIADEAQEIVAARTGYALEIGDLDLDLLSLTPSATVTGTSVDGGELEGLLDAGRAEASIDLVAALGGEIVIDRVAVSDATVRLTRDADGRTSWVPGTVEDVAEEPVEPDGGELVLPTIREARIEGLDVVWDDAVTGTEAALDVAANGSTLPDEEPLTVTVDGTANGAPVGARLALESALGDAAAGGPVKLALEASTDGAALSLAGRVDEPGAFGGVDLALDADVDSLDALGTALGTELPPLAPATLVGTVRTENEDVVVVLGGSVDGEDVDVALALDLDAPVAETLANGGPVRLDLDAAVGGASLDASGGVADWKRLDDVDLAFEANADSLDALESLTGAELPELEPATLSGTLRSDGERTVLDAAGAVDGEPVRATAALESPIEDALAGGRVELGLDAAVGGARVGLAGSVGDLARLEDVDLALEADVESLDALETLTGAELPEIDSANLTASLKSEGEATVLLAEGAVDGEPVRADLELGTPVADALAGGPVELDLDAAVGGARVEASGSVGNLARLEDVDLALDARIDSLDAIETLTGADLSTLDAANLSATVKSEGRGYAVRADGDVNGEAVEASLDLDSSVRDALAGEPVELDLDATVGGASVSASGRVGNLATLEGSDLALDVDVDSLDAIEALLGTELPDVEPASLDATLTREGDATVLTSEGTVGGEPARARVRLGTPLDEALAGGPVTLDVDAAVGGASVTASGSVGNLTTLADVNLELGVDVESLDAIETLLGTELPELEPATLSATVESEGGATTLEADGTVDGAPVNATLALESSIEGLLAGGPVELDLDAAMGGAKLRLDGRVEDPAALGGVDVRLDADVESLDAIETLLGTELPELAPATLDASLATEGDEYVVDGFELDVAGSRLTGNARVDPTTGPPTAYADVTARRLDVDALLDAFGLGGDEGGDEEETVEAANDEDADGPVLPSDPLPVDLAFGTVRGAFDLDVEELVYEALPLDSFGLRAELAPERVTLELDPVSLAGGDVDATLAATPVEGGGEDGDGDGGESALDAKLDARISRVQVQRFLPDIEIVDDAGGLLGGQVELWAKGDSVAGLAASLDGGVSLLMGQGELDALLVELAGLDLFQSIGDLIDPREKEFGLRCAYASLLSDAGVVTVDELVVDSADTVFLARGAVDLGAETWDLALEPHPKDPSLLSANTGVAIGGTFASPAIEVGAELSARAAAAAALAVVATPAAALLPFIELGGGEDSGFCDLEGALDGDAG